MTIRVGVIGIHGFSRTHLTQFLARQAAGDCTLVGAVAHERAKDESYAAELESSGVRLVSDLDALLALGPDLVSVPLGIHLHLPVTEKCLAAGTSVYLEKPVAGSVAEVDRLIALEQRAGKPVIVGFQDLFQPGIRELKRRLAGGLLGRITAIDVTVGWPRPHAYYARNGWAGKLKVGDAWVRDSIANNACAHFLNVALFLAGSTEDRSAQPASVTAELGRGNRIESFDTCSLTTATVDGPTVRFTGSHLGTATIGPRIRITGERGIVETENVEGGAPWILPDGSTIESGPRYEVPYRNALDFLRGKAVPVCRLHHARPHTVVIEAAHTAGPIADLPGCSDDGKQTVHPRMDEALGLAHAKCITLGQTGLVPGLVPATLAV